MVRRAWVFGKESRRCGPSSKFIPLVTIGETAATCPVWHRHHLSAEPVPKGKACGEHWAHNRVLSTWGPGFQGVNLWVQVRVPLLAGEVLKWVPQIFDPSILSILGFWWCFICQNNHGNLIPNEQLYSPVITYASPQVPELDSASSLLLLSDDKIEAQWAELASQQVRSLTPRLSCFFVRYVLAFQS